MPDETPPTPIPSPEHFWAEVLSAEPGRIRQALSDLTDDERRAVVAHLRRMSDEAGWQPQQREGARAALAIVDPARQEDA